MVEVPSALVVVLEASPVAQRPFDWSRSSWTDWLGGVEGAERLLQGLPDAVDRSSTVGTVQAELAARRYAEAFIAAMVWGHGDRNYGPFRTAQVLSQRKRPRGCPAQADVLSRLGESAQIARTNPVAAFRYLNNPPGHIWQFGPAFFTKWLYFASAHEGHHSPAAAPVLDDLVRGWLFGQAGIDLKLGDTSNYERYLELLGGWGQKFNRTLVQVEEAIFVLARAEGTVSTRRPLCRRASSARAPRAG